MQGHMEQPAEVTPPRPSYRLEMQNLPEGDVSIRVDYEDVIEPVIYKVGPVPDGNLVYVFPVIGSGGRARVFVGEELVGSQTLDAPGDE